MNEYAETANANGEDDATKVFDLIVIGAGVAGIYQLVKARELGLRVLVLEAAGGVGGTWYWNGYPGAQLDSESYSYGYFFSKEILDKWMWSEEFVHQPELERYFNFVVDELNLRKHILFNARVVSAKFDERSEKWQLVDDSGRKYTTQYVVAATGMLSVPYYPAVPGLEKYRGEVYHTAEWPKTETDFSGKRVAVIGTGSSGIQIVATLKSLVAEMTVYQRTPNWATPVNNSPILPECAIDIRSRWSEIHERAMSTPAGFVHRPIDEDAMSVSEDEREAIFEHLWSQPGQSMYASNFRDIGVSPDANDAVTAFMARKIRQRVNNQKIADLLIPTHRYGTKRPPLEDGYYEAFNQENVRLVDLFETPIEEFTEHGIRTSAGEDRFDAIILATGFDAVTGALMRLGVVGQGGKRLEHIWANGPKTFLGMLVPDLPNFFLANGPQSVNGNIPRAIEYQVNWITRLIATLIEKQISVVKVDDSAAASWVAHIDSIVKGQLKADVDSWFFGSNVPGKPRSYLLYPGTMPAYRKTSDQVAENGYVGLLFDGEAASAMPLAMESIGR